MPDPFLDLAPRDQHRHDADEGGEDDHEQAEAVEGEDEARCPSSGIQARSKISSQGPPDPSSPRRSGGPRAREPARARRGRPPARATGRRRRCAVRRTRRPRRRGAGRGSAEPASCEHHDGDGDDRAETDAEGVGPDPAVLGARTGPSCRPRRHGRGSRRSRRTGRRAAAGPGRRRVGRRAGRRGRRSPSRTTRTGCSHAAQRAWP